MIQTHILFSQVENRALCPLNIARCLLVEHWLGMMERKRAIFVATDILGTIARNVHLRRELAKVCAEHQRNLILTKPLLLQTCHVRFPVSRANRSAFSRRWFAWIASCSC